MRLTHPRRWSLLVKIPLTITAVTFGFALTVGLIVIQQNWARQQQELENRTRLLAEATAASAAEMILRNDVWSLYRALRQVKDPAGAAAGDNAIAEAMFLDAHGDVLAHTDPVAHPLGRPFTPGSDDEARLLDHVLASTDAHIAGGENHVAGFVDAVIPIDVDGTKIGFLLMRATTLPLQQQLRADAMVILAASVGLALLGSTIGAAVSLRMVSPLRALHAGLDAILRGEIERARPVEIKDEDEIGQLSRQFNLMISELAEKKRLERELARAERLSGLGRFVAGVAHEVNNPLGGMLNCVSTLRKHPGDEQLVRRYLPLLETGLTRISATMQALLGELRGDKAVSKPCALGCIADLEALVRAEIGERPVALDWGLKSGDLDGARIDCTCPHLHQIVLNLIRNAIQAMPEGGELRVATDVTDSELILTVADDGPGIDAAAQEKIFEPFYSTNRGGTGLGLWITYRLIDRMGGRVEIDSAPGEGTRFTVRLPLSAGKNAAGTQDDGDVVDHAA